MINILVATSNAHKLQEIKAIKTIFFPSIKLRFISIKEFLPSTLTYASPMEDGTTYKQNAIIKAKDLYHYCTARHLLGQSESKLKDQPNKINYILADDSGIELEALNNAPGLYSARYYLDPQFEHFIQTLPKDSPIDEKNRKCLLYALNAKLCNNNKKVKNKNIKASFVSSLALLNCENYNNLKTITHSEARWDGYLATSPIGEHGFGYDPLFIPSEASLQFLSHKTQYKQELLELKKLHTIISVALLPETMKNQISHRALALKKLLTLFIKDRHQ